MMFSTLALLPLSWGDEDQSKCPLLDWNVFSGASPLHMQLVSLLKVFHF